MLFIFYNLNGKKIRKYALFDLFNIHSGNLPYFSIWKVHIYNRGVTIYNNIYIAYYNYITIYL
jgi:hypothetical protein